MATDPAPHEGPLPLFPLPNVVLFPHTMLPLHIFEPRYYEMVTDAAKGSGLIGMIRPDPAPLVDTHGNPALLVVGCAGRITELTPIPENRYNLKLVGVRKFEIREEVRRSPYRTARVRWITDQNEQASGEKAGAAVERLLALLSDADVARGEKPLEDPVIVPGTPFAGAVNVLATTARIEPDELQSLLELRDVYARARRMEKILTGRRDARRRVARFRRLLPENPGQN